MDIAGHHIPGLVSAAGTFASVYGVFARFDRIQSRNNRRFVGRWLAGLSAPQIGWDSFFVELFQRIFGTNHWSVKCLLRSALMSLFIINIPVLYFVVNITPVVGNYWLDPVVIYANTTLICLACIVNYLSLWKTRLL